MKKEIVIFTLMLSLCACVKKEGKNTVSPVVGGNSLVGSWKLTAVLADPGDGSGVFYPVNNEKIITFNNSGTVNSNGSLCNMSLASNTNYTGVYSSDSLFIKPDSCPNISLGLEMSGADLIINYLCIERCSEKYVKLGNP